MILLNLSKESVNLWWSLCFLRVADFNWLFWLITCQGGDENLYASIQVLRDRVEEISHDMENKEMRARMTMCNLLSQQNGPMSQEVSQFQDDHLHQMEDLGRQLRQQQDNLLQLQRERAAKYVMNLSNSNIPMTNDNCTFQNHWIFLATVLVLIV